ncbi:LysR family transcriptional regulator [Corynebacterium crudilactis]|uniref:LysR family transcriptional regulator n=1 Tax=Corynebacterium crudilactis TaxID=1652495 RepID=A0A172QR13_9CORY|nr:LysR family transcriptional regulator [Corynebacterium crudilactis]ANE03135.1 LysR family transcriptional regulator [Corynebacterium crudilactis]
MHLNQLEFFIAVAQHGQINRAAEEMLISQPALSRQIAALEKSVGAPLFERHSRGVSLTKAGEILHEEALRTLSRMQSVVDEIQSGEHLITSIKIGVPPGTPIDWLRGQLVDLDSHIRISLIESPTDDQLKLLKQRELDIALCRRQSESFATSLVQQQDLGIVVRKDSPCHRAMKDRDKATLFDLADLRVLAHSRGEVRIQEEILKNAMLSAGVSATWIFRKFGQYSSLIADLVKADVALTTEESARTNFPSWQWIPLEGEDASGNDLIVRTWITWNPQPSPEVKALIQKFIGEI